MSKHEEIKSAYQALGEVTTFYDGMITCSTLPGKAVCRLVWDVGSLSFPDGSFDIVLSLKGKEG